MSPHFRAIQSSSKAVLPLLLCQPVHGLADHAPGAIEEFVDLVVRELQSRGRFWRAVRWADAARPSRSGSLTRLLAAMPRTGHPSDTAAGGPVFQPSSLPNAERNER